MTVLQSSVDWVLEQAHIRLGDDYVYGGVYSPDDVSQGADCSGVVGWVLEALVNTPGNMSWSHNVSTESWAPGSAPGDVGPYGTISVGSDWTQVPTDAVLTVNIMHGGGGEDSHTNCALQDGVTYGGRLIESNGDYGSCTNGTGAYATSASLWTDHWYLPGPVVADVGPTPPPAPTSKTYTVQSGDSLSDIANRFNVTLEALEQANPEITDPNAIFPGQVVQIP